jgi:hypothetical protein
MYFLISKLGARRNSDGNDQEAESLVSSQDDHYQNQADLAGVG